MTGFKVLFYLTPIIVGVWGLVWAIAVTLTWRYRARIVQPHRPYLLGFVLFFGSLNAFGAANYLIHTIMRGQGW